MIEVQDLYTDDGKITLLVSSDNTDIYLTFDSQEEWDAFKNSLQDMPHPLSAGAV